MRSIRVPWVVIALAASPALAQDALRGKRLYLDAARMTGSSVSCVDCHGGFPPGLFQIGQAANNPAKIANAIASIPQMAPLRGRLSSQDVADVASFLGNPAVPSPVLRTMPLDRIDYGTIASGTRSTRRTLMLSNDGALPLHLTSAARVTGPEVADFAIADSTCANAAQLAPGASCEIGVIFRPTAAGARTAALQIDHDWVGGIAAVALLGTAVDSSAANAPVGAGGEAQRTGLRCWR
jgi:hypothetical protein